MSTLDMEYESLCKGTLLYNPKEGADKKRGEVYRFEDEDFIKEPEVGENEETEINDDEGLDQVDDSSWSKLPDLILERIFCNLATQDKYYASLTCRSWYNAFHLPNSWRIFVFDDRTLTRRIFNYYSGWQYILDHLRTQLCLNVIGRHIKCLNFLPMSNFYNLYEFMNMISFYAEHDGYKGCNAKGVGSKITHLKYVFPCNMASNNETRLYGTGGKLLEAVKRLMGNLLSLKSLELMDLMLDNKEAIHLLDTICYSHCTRITHLTLINISKNQCELLHAGVFINLQVLKISPQSLGSNLIELVSDSNIRQLHIIQNSYTPSDVQSVPGSVWKKCRENNKMLQVHLKVQSKNDTCLIWQENAPVVSVIYESTKIQPRTGEISKAVEMYSNTMETYGYLCLPRYYQPKSYEDRMDSFWMYMCHNVYYLKTLIIRDRVSTCTLILLSINGKNLENITVRRNCVILRCDCPKLEEWNEEYYKWLKETSKSYEKTEWEISVKFERKWNMLTDKEFLRLSKTL